MHDVVTVSPRWLELSHFATTTTATMAGHVAGAAQRDKSQFLI